MAKAIEKTASHASVGVGVGDGAVVPDGGVVAGCVVGGTVVVGVVGGMVAGVVAGVGVLVVWVVVTAVGVGWLVVVVDMVVPPMEKLRILESAACMSNEAGSCHFAWTV